MDTPHPIDGTGTVPTPPLRTPAVCPLPPYIQHRFGAIKFPSHPNLNSLMNFFNSVEEAKRDIEMSYVGKLDDMNATLEGCVKSLFPIQIITHPRTLGTYLQYKRTALRIYLGGDNHIINQLSGFEFAGNFTEFLEGFRKRWNLTTLPPQIGVELFVSKLPERLAEKYSKCPTLDDIIHRHQQDLDDLARRAVLNEARRERLIHRPTASLLLGDANVR
eukprot:GHVO01018809.1.p1 GENE.GHVO01018809.1~~GHVO01018809.1.p1  ORF type:complete len:245 (+),score=44.05 GHVO01018809.1:84-737(+)